MKTCVNFTAEQVLAALRGEVVVVREAVKADLNGLIWCGWILDSTASNDKGKAMWVDKYPLSTKEVRVSPPYVYGNTLWVRETWQYVLLDYSTDWETGYKECGVLDWLKGRAPKEKPNWGETIYRENLGWDEMNTLDREHGSPWPWRPSIQMPRWASRLNMRVTDVRVEQTPNGWEWVAEMVKEVQG